MLLFKHYDKILEKVPMSDYHLIESQEHKYRLSEKHNIPINKIFIEIVSEKKQPDKYFAEAFEITNINDYYDYTINDIENISGRLYNCLSRSLNSNIGDLLSRGQKDIPKIRNLGKICQRELKDIIIELKQKIDIKNEKETWKNMQTLLLNNLVDNHFKTILPTIKITDDKSMKVYAKMEKLYTYIKNDINKTEEK